MKNANGQENENSIKIPVSSGVGIFTGPVPEKEAQSANRLLAILGSILTIIVIWLTVRYAEGELLLYIPAALCIITTVFLIVIAVNSYRKPIKPVQTIDIDGVWISNETIRWGKKTVELEDEHFIADLYSSAVNPINLSPEMTVPQNQKSFVDTTKGTVTFQIAHSRTNNKKYKMVFVHVSESGKDLHSLNLLSGKPVLIVNGKLHSLNHLSLADQLRNVADTVKSFAREDVNPCSLLITPRTQVSIGIPLATGAIVGGIAQSFADSKSFNNIVNAIAKGEFIDPETGKFLLELIQNYKWKVGHRPLGDKELGAFDQW